MITTDILYQITCDQCGKDLPNEKGGHWFKTEEEALNTAAQFGWRFPKDKHICYQCFKQSKRKKC